MDLSPTLGLFFPVNQPISIHPWDKKSINSQDVSISLLRATINGQCDSTPKSSVRAVRVSGETGHFATLRPSLTSDVSASCPVGTLALQTSGAITPQRRFKRGRGRRHGAVRAQGRVDSDISRDLMTSKGA
eukprot:s2229_g7.t1